MGYKFIVAETLADKVLGEDYEVIEKTLGKDLNVFFPITTILPDVTFLKYFKSFGKDQIKVLFLPSSKFSPTAAIIDIFIFPPTVLF